MKKKIKWLVYEFIKCAIFCIIVHYVLFSGHGDDEKNNGSGTIVMHDISYPEPREYDESELINTVDIVEFPIETTLVIDLNDIIKNKEDIGAIRKQIEQLSKKQTDNIEMVQIILEVDEIEKGINELILVQYQTMLKRQQTLKEDIVEIQEVLDIGEGKTRKFYSNERMGL